MNQTASKKQTRKRKDHSSFLTLCLQARWIRSLVLLASALILSSCGGETTKTPTASDGISGNWQFTMAAPADASFQGGLQGGFLVQRNGGVTGQVVYSITVPQDGGLPPLVCAGSASVTGNTSGQNVTLNVVAGTQNFALSGTVSADNSTMTGNYTSSGGQGCGSAQTGLQWTATNVPALNGTVTGSIHSTGSGTTLTLKDQNFLVTGALTQGPNTGASSATITGTLTFQDYPCLPTAASVNGQISGNSVILQIVAENGLNVGQIGAQPGILNPSPVTVTSSASGGPVLHGANGYGLSTKTCKGANLPGDVGNICLALGNSKACTQPVTLSPGFLMFPVQRVGAPATTQTVTLTNTDPSGSTLNGLLLAFRVITTSDSGNPSDFDLLPSFTEQDNCSSSPGTPFDLGPQQSCNISVSFSPQQSCPWLTSAGAGGAAPSQCPPFLGTVIPSPPGQAAVLTVTSPVVVNTDSDTSFAVPITGTGVSLVVPSTPELDFGSEAISQPSPAQMVTFTNQGNSPVQVLPAMATPPCGSPGQPVLLPRPLIAGSVPGVQVVTNAISFASPTITYTCDIDPMSHFANFQITSDTCSGTLLAPQQSCNVAVVFAPQPGTPLIPVLDYLLELNTLQCTSTMTPDCEIDSGRFPVELKANLPSPLRMTPGAGLDFGVEPKGVPTIDMPQTITLFNDPSDPNSQTIHFSSKVVKGDYNVTDDCGFSLAPGSSCTLTVIFNPKIIGFDQGSVTFTYDNGQIQTILLRGFGE